MLNKSNIRDYQLSLIKEIKARDKVLLAVDMGLGKTISCLTAIEESPAIKKVLIVAPKTVAETTWPDEFANWEHLKDLTYTVIKGTEKQRLKCLLNDTQFYIIGRDNMAWLYNSCNIDFDMLIWDESSSLKGAKVKTPTGNLSRFGALMKMTEKIKKVALLTGTPTPNGLEDIFGQILVIDRGEALGKSKNKFMEEYFIDRSHDSTYKIWEPRKSSYNEVMGKVEPLIIKMKSEDYITLPEFMPLNIYVEMDKKETELYHKLKEHFILNNDAGQAEIVAANKAVLTNKLLQCATGSVYRQDGTYRTFHTLKVDALKDLIEENPNETFLIFYNYKHERDQLEKTFKDILFLKDGDKLEGWVQQKIKKWNEGKIKLLACHPASAGHGLNLQHGGSIMVWVSLPWSLELYQQANKRLHRSGQLKNVRCYHILTKKTMDEHILKVLQAKDARQDLIFKLMRDLK